MILSSVTDNTTLKSCTLASNELSDLLQDRKTECLFEFVLPILFESENECMKNQLILNLRLVCPTWRCAIDSFIQEHPSRKAYCSSYFETEELLTKSYNYVSDCYSRSRHVYGIKISPVNDSLSRFNELRSVVHQHNPFISRSVVLTIGMDLNIQDPHNYIMQVKKFAKEFGPHIYFLTLTISQYFLFNLFSMTSNEEQFLNFFPNLRTLAVLPTEVEILCIDLRKRIENTLSKMTPKSYFLPHFEAISICTKKSDIPPIMNDYFLKPFMENKDLAQLTRISVPTWNDLGGKTFLNLKELTLNKLEVGWTYYNLGNLKAPILEKLILHFNYYMVNVEDFHKSLLRFRDSLWHVEVDWFGIEVDLNLKPVLLLVPFLKNLDGKLDKVHTLRISYALGVDYRLLRWFPNLKRLFLGHTIGALIPFPWLTSYQQKVWQKIVLDEEGQGGVQKINMYGMHKLHARICMTVMSGNYVNG